MNRKSEKQAKRNAARAKGRRKASGMLVFKGDKELLRFAAEQAARWSKKVAAKRED